jgi:hypothetical protein
MGFGGEGGIRASRQRMPHLGVVVGRTLPRRPDFPFPFTPQTRGLAILREFPKNLPTQWNCGVDGKIGWTLSAAL